MPQAIAAQLVAWGVSQAVASIAAYAVTTAATYFASGLLRGGPPKPDASEREHKSPTPPRIHVLGARRVFWSAMLYTNTSDSETVDVGAFCDGPINAVLQPYLNDDKVTISGGYVQPLSDGSYDDNKCWRAITSVPIRTPLMQPWSAACRAGQATIAATALSPVISSRPV